MTPRLLLLAVAGALLVLAVGEAEQAEAKANAAKVKVEVTTKSQAALLERGRLQVRVKSRGRKAKVRLTARRGKAKRLVEPRQIRVRKGQTRRTRLALTNRGRRTLGACGGQRVVVRGRYRPGKGKRRRVARGKARLKRDASRCPVPVDPPNPERCDPIDTERCLLPFPNDFYTSADPGSDTGRRLDLERASMPANTQGIRFDPAEYNRNDGFSPNAPLVTKVPALETDAAFAASGIVSQGNIAQYARPNQPVVVINAETGERHPVWAELDKIPTDNGDRTLIIRPAVAYEYGTRYLVALRNLKGASGQPLQPGPVFAAYRDGRETDNAAVETRRPAMEEIFAKLGQAGIARADLYLAWDFTVAGEDNLTGRLRAMRDDAFAQLGDVDLADGTIQGDPPEIDVDGVVDYDLCGGTEAEPEPCQGRNRSNYTLKRITGTIEVPCYMDEPPASSGVANRFPCGPGSRLHYEGSSEVPSQNGDLTYESRFTCLIPRDGFASGDMAIDKPGVLFGHGLLGDHTQVEQLRLFPGALEGVACGTSWIGMSSHGPDGGDLGAFLPALLGRLDRFPALPDRSQQGMLNVLYLGRAMAHEDGLRNHAELEDGDDSALLPDSVGFLGISQGGIFGGATTSVAPDFERAVLGVPGMGFATLLTRSTQFNQFLPLVYSAYPDPIERQVGFSLLQTLWDRGETSGYVHRMTDEPFSDTRPHRVLLQEAFGDHQVTNIQTQSEARTIGAVVRAPIVAPGRSLDTRPYWNLERSTAGTFAGAGYGGPAALFSFDTGPIRIEEWNGQPRVVGTNPNPLTNRAPRDAIGLAPHQWLDGLDPHEPVATSPFAQAQILEFLSNGGIIDPCVPGEPCTAPPVHVPGEGM